jgi:hypothetical protein
MVQGMHRGCVVMVLGVTALYIFCLYVVGWCCGQYPRWYIAHGVDSVTRWACTFQYGYIMHMCAMYDVLKYVYDDFCL